MPPKTLDPNQHGSHLVPRGLSGPTQGVVIGTLVGSFVFFGLLIWLYHCVNEDKGAYSNPLYSRPPSPPRRLHNLGPPNGGLSPQGRSYSLSPSRAPRPLGGLGPPVNSPLPPVRRAASHAPAPSRASSPLRPRVSSPFRARPPPRPRTPSPGPPPQEPRVPRIQRTSPSARRQVPPLGRDLQHDLERARPRDLRHDLNEYHAPGDTGPTALQLERERDLARRMAKQNDRERSRRSSSLGRRPPRILAAEPGNPARRPLPSSSSSSSMASSGPVILMAESGRSARRRAPPSSSSSSSSGPVIVMAEPENSARRGQLQPPPSSSSNLTLVPSASPNGRRGGNRRSQPPMATTAHPRLGALFALAEPRRPHPPLSSSLSSSSLGEVRHGRRRAADPTVPFAEPGRRPFQLPPPFHYGNPTASDARNRSVTAAANELRYPSRRPSSSVSSSQGTPRGRARDTRDSGRRGPPRSASSAGGRSEGARMNRSYERVRRVPGAWRD